MGLDRSIARPGEDLQAWSKRLEHSLTQIQIEPMLAAVLDVLEIIHESGHLHLAITPRSIIVGYGGWVLLSPEPQVGPTRIFMGYSPPELYPHVARKTGAWSDVYGIAATVYSCLTGTELDDSFERLNDEDGLPKLQEISRLRQMFNNQLLAGLDWGMRPQIQDRPQTISEWRTELGIGYRAKQSGTKATAESNSSVDDINREATLYLGSYTEDAAQEPAGLHALLPEAKRGQKLIDALKKASPEEFSQIVRDPGIVARIRNAFREIEAESTDRKTPKAEAATIENLGPPVPALSKAALVAIAKRAAKKPWAEHKSEYRGRVFEFVRDTYGEWIPGLLQSHLKLDKTGLYNVFAQAISRNGLPPWLDVPSEKDAALRNTTDPDERRRMIIGRSHHRVINRRWRARLQHK